MKKYALLMVLLVMFGSGCGMKVVEDGQTGVKADFGKIADAQLDTGVHFYCPLVSWIEVWNTKTQEIKETANVPSSEGLISSLDVSVLFNIKKENAVLVRKTIGPYFS